jgi:hypothetical protein
MFFFSAVAMVTNKIRDRLSGAEKQAKLVQIEVELEQKHAFVGSSCFLGVTPCTENVFMAHAENKGVVKGDLNDIGCLPQV